MAVMTAFAWCGIFFLVAAVLRAKVRFLGNLLVPACLIGGVIGCIFMNTTGLYGVEVANFSPISGQFYTFMFINLGITLAAKKSDDQKITYEGGLKGIRQRMGDSQLSGIFGMGSFWALAYAYQALIGMGLLYIIGGAFDMDPVYGLIVSFCFAQGPGQAVTYGTVMETAGWANAIQVGMLFSAIGFLVAFIFGVPYAKKGVRNGIACAKTHMSDELRVGFYPPEKQETYGKITTYGGNMDVMTFHLSLVGLSWVLGQLLGKFWAIFPGYFGELFPTLLFFNGMVAAYILRWVMGKLGLHKYMDRGTQNRITNACTDFMVISTFMAIDFQVIGKWVIPMLIIAVVVAAVTWITINYFAPRFGGRNDFERLLGEWGTVTGTNATGLALVRIADPNNETTTAAELGPANAVNVPASYFVAPGILAYAAGEMGLQAFLIAMFGVIAAYLVFMKVIGVWGKKTYDINKGEKYRDGKCYQRMGEPVDE